jgi:hypothetical protein
MMLIRTLILPMVLAVTACGEKEIMPDPDQCMRREIFQQCLRALPAGPVSTKYNDRDEVVKSCESAAYYQSLRQPGQIKPECKV